MALRLRYGLLSSRPLFVIGIVLPTVIFVAAGWYEFRLERNRVRNDVLSTSAALAEHGQKVVETTDLVLARVLDRTSEMDWASIQSSKPLHDFIAQLRDELPQLESIFLIAPDGHTVANSRTFPLDILPDVGDRDYVTHAREGNSGTFISAPYNSRIDGRLTFAATRVRLRDGKFDGVIGATISPDYLHEVYSAVIDYPGHSTATLVRTDGVVLFRHPPLPGGVMKMPAQSAVYEAGKRPGDRGIFEGPSAIDGRQRIWAYRRLTNQPLLVGYSIDDAVYRRAWFIDMLFMAAFSGLLAAALLLTERVIARRTASEISASHALLAEVERRQKAELALEQSQKMEALGRLTGGVAHDFNNLLTAIMGPLELATKRSSDPRVVRLLGGAMQAAQRGAALTAQMLAVARKREVAVRPLDPNEAIQEMGEMIARTIGPMVRVRYELDPAASPVAVNLVQMEVTLLNLALNARDAMPGGGEMVLRTERLELGAAVAGLPAGDYVRISVVDSGEGMTEEVRARALEPFFTTKETGKGTGLGLSTAYGFAQSVGGTVSIDSAPGAGTIVMLTLPRVAGAIPEALRPTTARAVAPARILLVDDDNAVRMATREVLEDLGHEVVDFDNGRAALDTLARDVAFDLVATDFAMAEMNGSQLAEAVRQRIPTMPILFVTGYAKDDGLQIWDGRNTWTLDKPFSSQDLARAVARAAGAQHTSAMT
ncbi:hybrid sensor histidine kinase/response regulator [Acidisphaera sp. L21]|uniref:hybrid sensor histidine kinase/response regulator n=1 Tax=Acidisphaera sp. L21 TaxID=1641851 RepID=UPI00131E785C|nr:hybrid sensor histidine kinase/response regulator [Acidisphaera sp. L21]